MAAACCSPAIPARAKALRRACGPGAMARACSATTASFCAVNTAASGCTALPGTATRELPKPIARHSMEFLFCLTAGRTKSGRSAAPPRPRNYSRAASCRITRRIRSLSFWSFSARSRIACLAPSFRLSRILPLWRPCSVKMSAKLLRRDTSQFAMLCEEVLQRGLQVRFLAHGQSMQPNVLNGDAVIAEPVDAHDLRRGDIALTLGQHGVLLHRVIGRDPATNRIVTRGDAGQQDDTPAELVLGRAVCIERDGKRISLQTPGTALLHAVRTQMYRLWHAGTRRIQKSRGVLGPCAFILLATLLHAAPVWAQALTITDTAAPTTVAPGGTITYTQVLHNGSGVAVTKPLTTTQNLPPNTTFVSAAKASGDQAWTCTNTAGVITCNNTSGANYANGDTTTFTIVVTVNAATANGTVITDTVNAQGANTAV